MNPNLSDTNPNDSLHLDSVIQREQALKRSKRIALLFLIAATAIFLISLFLPKTLGVLFMKAVAEAAMIGALADWFAVTALFRRVHIPFISKHTEIIPRNKERIANNLASFVHEKFFNEQALTELLKKANLAHKLALWLDNSKNCHILAEKLNTFIRSILNIVDDAAIQHLLINAFHELLAQVDLSRGLGSFINSLTRDGRHEPILDDIFLYLGKKLDSNSTQEYLAQGIITWLETEHPNKEKILPTQWIGRNGAKLAIDALGKILLEIANDPEHKIRKDLNKSLASAIEKLKTDEAFKERAELIKNYLRDDEKLKEYLSKLWQSARKRIIEDTQKEDSIISKQVIRASKWFANNLKEDEYLRQSLNRHINDILLKASPELTKFLITHISDTVKNWDDKDMSKQIELNIGKDLQYIRINGTIVGGMIGCIIFILTNIPQIIEYFKVTI